MRGASSTRKVTATPSVRDWKLYFTFANRPVCTNLSAAACRSSFPTCVPLVRPLRAATCGSEIDFNPSARTSLRGAVPTGAGGAVCAHVERAKSVAKNQNVQRICTCMGLVYRKTFVAAERDRHSRDYILPSWGAACLHAAGGLRCYRKSLFNGDGFREIARLVYVAAPAHGNVISEELQGNDLKQG